MRTPRFFVRWLLILGVLLSSLSFAARDAVADPWFGFGQNAAEDRYADGDFDADDAALMRSSGHRHASVSEGQARTWVSLIGFASHFPNGAQEVGAGVIVGIAFDKIGRGGHGLARDRAPPFPDAGLADGAPSSPSPSPQSGKSPQESPPAPEPAVPLLGGDLARGAVRAAWRTAGVDVTDARIDDMIARARRSAALPETRLRALRVLNSGEDVTYVDASGHVYDTIGANLSLEARLTWRLDRLLYADDEPTLERVRLERQEARARLGTHVLELIFAWQRAVLDLAATTPGSRGETEALVRRWESEVALDVLTSGWFGGQGAVRGAGARQRP